MTTPPVHGAIWDLLDGRLLTLDESPMPPVAWQNLNFDHTKLPAGTIWLQPVMFFNTPDERFLGEPPILQGLYQVSVHQKAMSGAVKFNRTALTNLASSVKDHFSKTVKLADDDYSVAIYREPELAAPLIEGEYMTIPVTVSWRCYSAY